MKYLVFVCLSGIYMLILHQLSFHFLYGIFMVVVLYTTCSSIHTCLTFAVYFAEGQSGGSVTTCKIIVWQTSLLAFTGVAAFHCL